jgi:hypothetical protein
LYQSAYNLGEDQPTPKPDSSYSSPTPHASNYPNCDQIVRVQCLWAQK